MSRTDLITLQNADAQPVILETQTLPGMTPTSLIPQQCAAAGISFAGFIDLLIENALWRQDQDRMCHE
jgi:D-alanine-D-alanine ligase